MSQTYFVDYAAGSDGAAGTSFATRKKTITSAIALASPGDSIRVMKSPDATDMGQTATVTYQSNTVTLASSVTQMLYSDGTWTGVTNSVAGTSITRKEGATCATLNVLAGFTTGKLGFFATGTLNLSTYQQVSFWFKSSINLAAGVLRLDLCSDATGATPVNSFTINQPLAANQFHVLTFNNAAALGSSIASVALFAISDPGTVLLTIDDVIACKAVSSADSLTLSSLIGVNDGYWYGLKSINDVTLTLDTQANNTANAFGMSASSGTWELWKKETITTTAQQTQQGVVEQLNVSGSFPANYINITGGWDTTAMTSQTGDSWFDGGNGFGLGMQIQADYLNIGKLGVVRYFTGWTTSSTFSSSVASSLWASNNVNGFQIINGSSSLLSSLVAVSNSGNAISNSGNAGLMVYDSCSAVSNGIGFNDNVGGSRSVTNLTVRNNQTNLVLREGFYFNNLNSYDAQISGGGVQLINGVKSVVNNLTINNSNGFIHNNMMTVTGNWKLNKPVLIGDPSSGGSFASLSGATLVMRKPTINTQQSSQATFASDSCSLESIQSLIIAGADQSPSLYNTDLALLGVYPNYYTRDYAVLPPGSTALFSLRTAVNQNLTDGVGVDWPKTLLTRAFIPSGATASFTYNVRVDNTANMKANFRIQGGKFLGVGSVGSDIVVPITGLTINTWGMITVGPISPLEDAVIEIYLETATGSSGTQVWVGGALNRT